MIKCWSSWVDMKKEKSTCRVLLQSVEFRVIIIIVNQMLSFRSL
jgi:hypothetical protein